MQIKHIIKASANSVKHSELLGFWSLSIFWYSKNYRMKRLEMRREIPILLGPLEKANLNHWTDLKLR
jgi:hypothetical protein